MESAWIWGHGALIGSYLMAIAGITHMLRHRRSPGSTIAWLLVLVSLPFLGTVMYLMFGGRKLRQSRNLQMSPEFEPRCGIASRDATRFDVVLQHYGASPATFGNRISICSTGQEGYRQLSELIDTAQQSLYLATFVFSHDKVARSIRDHLAARAREGVDVRVLIDGLGSLKTPRQFFQPFVEAGGRLAVFQPVIHIPFRSLTNLRNHRKIVVADNARSFAGGMNVTGDELSPDEETWIDVSLVVEGPAAAHLQSIFRKDWQTATGEDWDGQDELPSNDNAGNSIVQILPAGPDINTDPMYSASLTAIYRATQRIWIVTPYFVPNDPLIDALVFACQRHVDVRILLPLRSNHRLLDLAGATLAREIQRAGGTILRYRPGMVHAKVTVVDDTFAAVGSANFDMRSLFLNYEVMQLCYSLTEIEAVASWFESLATESKTNLPAPGFFRELGEGAVRMLAPLF